MKILDLPTNIPPGTYTIEPTDEPGVYRYVPQKPTYPNYPHPSIVQYDEHVFVWLDETGNAGGVEHTVEQALRSLREYKP